MKHTVEEIQKAWAAIFPDLLEAGYEVDSKPIFERYYGDDNEIDYCDICVTITLKK